MLAVIIEYYKYWDIRGVLTNVKSTKRERKIGADNCTW